MILCVCCSSHGLSLTVSLVTEEDMAHALPQNFMPSSPGSVTALYIARAEGAAFAAACLSRCPAHAAASASPHKITSRQELPNLDHCEVLVQSSQGIALKLDLLTEFHLLKEMGISRLSVLPPSGTKSTQVDSFWHPSPDAAGSPWLLQDLCLEFPSM